MTARKWPNLAQDRNATSSRCDGVLMGEQTMPRSWALFARACLPLVVVLVLVGGLLTIAYGVRAGGTQIAVRSCDPAVVMNHRLDELGRRGFTWTIKPDPIDEAQHSAVTSFDDPQVTISTKVTCALMTTVVNHEWMHVLQKQAIPENTERAYGGLDEIELIADCGSQLLGSTYMPYITMHRQKTGERGCPADDLNAAQWLLDQAHLIR